MAEVMWRTHVESLIQTDLSPLNDQASLWLNQSARKLLNVARIDDPELKPTKNTDSGTGVSIAYDNRVLFAEKNGRRCLVAPQADYGKYADTNSLMQAHAYTPVLVVKDDGKAYVLPLGGNVYTISAAAYDDITDTNNAGLWGSSSLGNLAIIDAALQAMGYLIGVLEADSLDTQYGALDSEYASLLTQYTALATDLDTQEDVELATAKLNEIGTRLQEMKVRLDARLADIKSRMELSGMSVAGYKEKLGMLKLRFDEELKLYLMRSIQ